MKRDFVRGALLASALGVSACGSDNKPAATTTTTTTDSSLTNQDNVRTWINGGSAFGVYGNVYQLFGVADGHEAFADATCPVVDDDGTTLTATGNCSEQAGTQWVGSATVVRSATGITLTLNDFGTRTDATHSDTKNGQAHLDVADATHLAFDVSLTHTAEVVTTFDYTGQVAGDYNAPTIWDGSGTMKRDGAFAPSGTVDLTTTDEVVDDDACSGQPLSGNTTVHDMADETVVVTYDGAVDCDDKQAASYSLNGDPKGQITGISCAISGTPGGEHGSAAWLLAALFGLGLARRARKNVCPRGLAEG